MGREIRRVRVDFDWPLGVVWEGFLPPASHHLPECQQCDGTGMSEYAIGILAEWSYTRKFDPVKYGFVPYGKRPDRVREIMNSPYARGPADTRTVEEYAKWLDRSPAAHISEDEGKALGDEYEELAGLSSEEIIERLIHGNLVSYPGSYVAETIAQARCARMGQSYYCNNCGGHGNIATPELRREVDDWTPTPPPGGDGYQLWETTSEGSPISPVFESPDQLESWMVQNPCDFGGRLMPPERAEYLIKNRWAPSMVITYRRQEGREQP